MKIEKPKIKTADINSFPKSETKSKYWKNCPKCGLEMTYGQLITDEWFCWNCGHKGTS